MSIFKWFIFTLGLVHITYVASLTGPETLDCHRRLYTYRVVQSDGQGKQCWDTLSVWSCWGRCDSNEVRHTYLQIQSFIFFKYFRFLIGASPTNVPIIQSAFTLVVQSLLPSCAIAKKEWRLERTVTSIWKPIPVNAKLVHLQTLAAKVLVSMHRIPKPLPFLPSKKDSLEKMISNRTISILTRIFVNYIK